MEGKGIYKAIVAVSKEIQPIAKEQENQQQHFKFRGIDNVYNMLQPLLSRHGIFTTSEVIERTERQYETKGGGKWTLVVIKMRYHFWAEDGSSVTSEVIGEGSDPGDKGSNKAMAIADKYALIQMFKIPTKDMPDPDAETPPEEVPTKTEDKAPKTKGAAQPPAAEPSKSMSASEGKKKFEQNAKDICIIPAGRNKGKRWDALSDKEIEECLGFYQGKVNEGSGNQVYYQNVLNYLKIIKAERDERAPKRK